MFTPFKLGLRFQYMYMYECVCVCDANVQFECFFMSKKLFAWVIDPRLRIVH